MKTAHLLATLIAATLPLASIVAEDSGKTDTTDQRQEQNSDMMAMKGMMGKGQMSNDSLPPRSGFPFSSTAGFFGKLETLKNNLVNYDSYLASKPWRIYILRMATPRQRHYSN
jgi:hypothetical protein